MRTWPPQTPDLNTIEMVWDELDRRDNEKQPTSSQHMWELLQDCWRSIPGDYIMKLVECGKHSLSQWVATLKKLTIYFD
jgi:hypothetical protein